MSKVPLVCCLVSLVMAVPARGQPPTALPHEGPSYTLPGRASLPSPSPPQADLLPPLPKDALNPAICAAPSLGPGGWYVTGEAEFLLWFTQGERPSRVGSLNGSNALGLPVQLGSADRRGPPLTGGRFSFGVWSPDSDPILDQYVNLANWGAEVGGFFLGERSVALSGGRTVPSLGTSTLLGRASFDIWGIEANVRSNFYGDPVGQVLRIDFLGGFRYLERNGDLAATSRTVFATAGSNSSTVAPLAGNQVEQATSFRVRNQFYGGQIGLGTKLFLGAGTVVGGDFKLAIGSVHQELNVERQIQATLPLPASLTGPFLADSGSFSRDKFSYVPELNLYVAVSLRKNLTVRVGYSGMYWSNIARTSDQIDLAPNPLGKVEVIRDRGLFLHGFNLGLQLSY